MRKYLHALLVIAATLGAACYEPVSDDSEVTRERTEQPGSRTAPAANKEIQPSATPGTDFSKQSETMTDQSTPQVKGFRNNVAQRLSREGLSIDSVADSSSPVERRVFEEYGAVYLTKAKPPSKAMFENDSEVLAFQSAAGISSENIGGVTIELQPAAMNALKAAVDEARSKGLSITPRDGADAGKRSYSKTLELWKSRFEPALKHWKQKGRLDDAEIARLKGLPIKQQVAEVLKHENQGIFFNTFFNNSILYSVAAPGTSQHLSMLAFDVTEFADKRVQDVLANHGWFRTVQNDAPHFTYLGHRKSDLNDLGLKSVSKKDGVFWIPNV